ncbi:hypothetical protein V5799_027990 [Amblyomma americanum]|uniref:Uncharacterized protein n=1 Tax=Amblyomma americanum TaxID=6943 RepID=A0AAQ4DE53_AMBAM
MCSKNWRSQVKRFLRTLPGPVTWHCFGMILAVNLLGFLGLHSGRRDLATSAVHGVSRLLLPRDDAAYVACDNAFLEPRHQAPHDYSAPEGSPSAQSSPAVPASGQPSISVAVLAWSGGLRRAARSDGVEPAALLRECTEADATPSSPPGTCSQTLQRSSGERGEKKRSLRPKCLA